MSKVNLVFTGVTGRCLVTDTHDASIYMLGYVGSAIVSAFLDHPNRANFNIITVVRSAEKVEKLKGFGINAVVGDLKDTAFVEKQASEADYYFSIVSHLFC